MSDDTGRTLKDILPGRMPMFGDPQSICPLNVIVGGGVTGDTDTGGDTGTDDGTKVGGAIGTGGGGPGGRMLARLRAFRDNTLLRSAAGAALVDVYYTAAPKLAAFIAEKPARLRAATAFVEAFAMIIRYRLHILLAGLLVAGLAWRGLRVRRARTGAVAGLLLLVLAFGGTAFAQGIAPDTATLTASADIIIQARVVAVESYHENNQMRAPIYTDISVEVLDTAKGSINKQSVLTFTQPGGRVDDRVTYSSAFPFFEEGEEAVLYLEASDRYGWMLVYGRHGKVPVDTDAESGAKTVRPGEFGQVAALRDTAADIAAAGGEKVTPGEGLPRLDLAAYLDHVQALAAAQAAAEETAE